MKWILEVRVLLFSSILPGCSGFLPEERRVLFLIQQILTPVVLSMFACAVVQLQASRPRIRYSLLSLGLINSALNEVGCGWETCLAKRDQSFNSFLKAGNVTTEKLREGGEVVQSVSIDANSSVFKKAIICNS